MKCNCPSCKAQIELDTKEQDEGDFVKCEECDELLEVEIKAGQFRLVTDQEKKYKDMEDLDESFDYEEDEE